MIDLFCQKAKRSTCRTLMLPDDLSGKVSLLKPDLPIASKKHRSMGIDPVPLKITLCRVLMGMGPEFTGRCGCGDFRDNIISDV